MTNLTMTGIGSELLVKPSPGGAEIVEVEGGLVARRACSIRSSPSCINGSTRDTPTPLR